MSHLFISSSLRIALATLIAMLLGIGMATLSNSASAADLGAKPLQTEQAPTHRVGAGDTLAQIARQYDTTISELLRLNPQITNPNRIFLGQVITVGEAKQGATETGAIDMTRIQFAAGTTSSTQTGTVGPNKTDSYRLSAAQGQEMTVTLEAPDGNVALAIIGPAGELLPLTDQTFIWRGTLPATGEYSVDIVSILGIFDKPYTLTVSIVDTESDVDGSGEDAAEDGDNSLFDNPFNIPTSITQSRTFEPQGSIDFNIRTDGDVSILDLADPVTGQVRQGFVVTSGFVDAFSESYSLLVEDMNYDGYDDFRLVEFLTAGANTPYLYYLYDPATEQFVFNSDLRAITSPQFVGSNTILSRWQLGAANWGIDIYAYVNEKPTLLVRQEWTASVDGDITRDITVFDPNDSTAAGSSNTNCQTILGPAQADGSTEQLIVCDGDDGAARPVAPGGSPP